jgi:hypothetical protein
MAWRGRQQELWQMLEKLDLMHVTSTACRSTECESSKREREDLFRFIPYIDQGRRRAWHYSRESLYNKV